MKKLKGIIALVLASCMLMLVGCGKKAETKTIKIATKPMAEQFILAEMLRLLIEDQTDIKVEITKGIAGGTSNIQPALLKGDFDMYPEYSGTGWEFVLKKHDKLNKEAMYEQLNKEYKEQFKLEWLKPYGFDNSFGLAVNKDFAEKNNIKTYSDLAKFSDQLIFGAEPDFYERDDGFKALSKEYGFKFKNIHQMDIGLKYEAMKQDKVQVINVFTTDAQLKTANVVVLEDDKNFFPTYFAATIVRQETLDKFPELRDILNKLSGVITEQDMIEMNYQVEVMKKDETMVAMEFLRSKGLVQLG